MQKIYHNVSEPVHTSGFPVESMRTKDDFPTFGAPTRQRVGVSRSITGIARKFCKYINPVLVKMRKELHQKN